MKFIHFKLIEPLETVAFWRAVATEVLGTFILVFIGCASVLKGNSDDPSQNSNDIIRISFVFGFTVMALVWTLGPVSGCHLNPSVSWAFVAIGRISLVRGCFYTVAQCIGSIMGAALLFGIVPEESHGNLGATGLANGTNEAQGFGCEFILTFLFLMTVCACVDDGRRNYKKNMASIPLTLGFCITLNTLVGISYSGASLNPARSLGPAVVGGFWESHWIYWVGPLSGGCSGGLIYHFLFSSALHPDIQPSRPPGLQGEMASSPRASVEVLDVPPPVPIINDRQFNVPSPYNRKHMPLVGMRSDAPIIAY